MLDITVVHAIVINSTSVELTFSDGTTKRINLGPYLYGEIFEPLKDPQYFQKMRLAPGDITISWPNGADFAPEFLYALAAEPVTPARA
jgi:hypothetical protein